MNGLDRTLSFLNQSPVDRPPFHPIIMRWAAKYAEIKYREFCLDYRAKCEAMLKCADDFGIDWVTVMSDPWAEAVAFGIKVDYPEDDLPRDVAGHLPDISVVEQLKPYHASDHARCVNRIKEIEEFRRRAGDEYFIVGWVEGPVAAYADIRGVTQAAFDLLESPEAAAKAMDVITESAMEFITLQIKAGAHCIGIGDAFCSQIGPKLYRQFAFEREKQLVAHIHSHGALAKLHICGNTSFILPDMIGTGSDIIDVDHLVPSMAPFTPLLAARQVFSGKTDPVSIIQDGTAEQIEMGVRSCQEQAQGRCIVSAGCEITPGTTLERMRDFRAACSPISTVA